MIETGRVSTSTGPRQKAAPFRVADYFGITIADVGLERLVEKADTAIAESRRIQIVTLNPHLFLETRSDPGFRAICETAELVIADGIGVAITGGIWRNVFPKRYSGIDFMLSLCKLAALKGYSIFQLGGSNGVAGASAARLIEQFPGLRVSGWHEPPLVESIGELDNEEIVRSIRAARPEMLFVGLGAPKQEKWIHEFRDTIDVPLMMGVGGSFDILSGRLPRAPLWIRALGLEWLFRLMLEPRRLAYRYCVGIPLFLLAVLRESFRPKRRGTAA